MIDQKRQQIINDLADRAIQSWISQGAVMAYDETVGEDVWTVRSGDRTIQYWIGDSNGELGYWMDTGSTKIFVQFLADARTFRVWDELISKD